MELMGHNEFTAAGGACLILMAGIDDLKIGDGNKNAHVQHSLKIARQRTRVTTAIFTVCLRVAVLPSAWSEEAWASPDPSAPYYAGKSVCISIGSEKSYVTYCHRDRIREGGQSFSRSRSDSRPRLSHIDNS